MRLYLLAAAQDSILQSAQFQRDAAIEAHPQALAQWLPHLSALASSERERSAEPAAQFGLTVIQHSLGMFHPRARLLASGVALILGGAVGNLIDRLRLGQVVDFVSAHWGPHYFPAFNAADSAITIGAILLLLDAWLEAR